eukprot:CAMPEP_0194248936 /NCGR_PEP_ID=MMETSP0158-20130606/19442_1 /TAXON_ID=33649 /ORGANISM="Thalassionema nitzschioides, Strain L26-B" /LENGTH=123 /DNA_ID=CAMNT_0038985355 /DNA_START=75 /DNA_END=446 /DNA_ORIENTATION=+
MAELVFDAILTRSSAAMLHQVRKCGVPHACETESRPGMGFRALAACIGVGTDPQNHDCQGVAMTTPVLTNPMKIMSFILPTEYDSFDKIPKPKNPNATITELPSSMGAAHTLVGISGFWELPA